jgi:predicted transcriptional regulator
MPVAKRDSSKLLTETELELMNIIWSLGEGTVHQVMEKLPKGRDLAYTSVSTILRILEEKRILKTRKEGRGHVYIPEVSKSDYESRTVQHMVTNVFSGTPSALIKQLLSSVDISAEELKEIKALLAKKGERA